jgi:hypothetical protein
MAIRGSLSGLDAWLDAWPYVMVNADVMTNTNPANTLFMALKVCQKDMYETFIALTEIHRWESTPQLISSG